MNYIRVTPSIIIAMFGFGVIVFATLAFVLLFAYGLYLEGNSGRLIMRIALLGVGFAYVAQLTTFFAEMIRLGNETYQPGSGAPSGITPNDKVSSRMIWYSAVLCVVSACFWFAGVLVAVGAV